MTRKLTLLCLPVFVLALTVAATRRQPAPMGPPWISLEVPANPLESSMRDAAFVVRTYHHENPARYPVVGTAEGLIDGERRTIELEFTETGLPGVYAVRQQWPSDGSWMLAMTVSTGGDTGPSLIVEMGPGGGVADSRFYGMSTKSLSLGAVRVVTEPLNRKRIDRALRAMAK